jgi:hypothetical protein
MLYTCSQGVLDPSQGFYGNNRFYVYDACENGRYVASFEYDSWTGSTWWIGQRGGGWGSSGFTIGGY